MFTISDRLVHFPAYCIAGGRRMHVGSEAFGGIISRTRLKRDATAEPNTPIHPRCNCARPGCKSTWCFSVLFLYFVILSIFDCLFSLEHTCNFLLLECTMLPRLTRLLHRLLKPFCAKRDKIKRLHLRSPLNRALTKELWRVKQKIVASPGFTSFRWALHGLHESMFEGALLVELFCQTIYQIGSNSTNITVYGAQAKKMLY
jgi:hypothetical protein